MEAPTETGKRDPCVRAGTGLVPPPLPKDGDMEELSLADLYGVMRRHAGWIIGITTIVMASVAMFVHTRPPVYVGTARISASTTSFAEQLYRVHRALDRVVAAHPKLAGKRESWQVRPVSGKGIIEIERKGQDEEQIRTALKVWDAAYRRIEREQTLARKIQRLAESADQLALAVEANRQALHTLEFRRSAHASTPVSPNLWEWREIKRFDLTIQEAQLAMTRKLIQHLRLCVDTEHTDVSPTNASQEIITLAEDLLRPLSSVPEAVVEITKTEPKRLIYIIAALVLSLGGSLAVVLVLEGLRGAPSDAFSPEG